MAKLTPRNNPHSIRFYDFQCSAQKSVSVMSLFDKRLEEAHRKAVGIGMKEMEKFAAVRIRKGDNCSTKNFAYTGKFIYAEYHHENSRLLDPQLHTHNVIVNVTQDVDGSFKALDASEIYRTIRYAGISNAELHWRKPLNGTFFPSDSPGGQALHVIEKDHGYAVFCQITPLLFDKDEFQYRTTRRRCHFLISRLAHNLGAKSNSGLLSQITAKNDESMISKGMVALSGEWLGKADPEKQGRKEKWFSYDFKPDDQWRKIKVPGMFDQQFEDLNGYDGWFWYHKTFDADNIPTNTELTLFFGTIDDESWIWLNGELIGELTSETNPKDYWAAERKYIIPSSKLKPRNNVITILCNDLRMGGGILGAPAIKFPPPYRLYPDIPESSDDPYRYYRW